LGKYRAYVLASRKKLGCLRRRLATEADSAVTATLTRLWEKETERCAIAIQKEIDNGNAQLREAGPPQLAISLSSSKTVLLAGIASRRALRMMTATQCQVLASEYKRLSLERGIAQNRAAMLTNIARSFSGLATQLDRLAAHTRDAGG
jgi:hypothetical protein